jgi:predicted nucleic acid-binding protein
MDKMPNLIICVDASFIVRLLIPDRFSEEAEQLWITWLQAETRIIAPTLILFEASASFRLMVQTKKISQSHGDKVFNDFSRIDILTFHDYPLRWRAWQLAEEFQQTRTYDMTYVALAEVNKCEFWTADERLYNSVHHRLPWVRWIGELATL